MFKPSNIDSTVSRRVRVARSVANGQADAAAGPQPIGPGFSSTVTKQGSSRPRVFSPEQPIEPLAEKPRSHSQERAPAVTNAPDLPQTPVFAGIDVAKDALDLATSQGQNVERFDNTSQGIALLRGRLAILKPACIVVEATGGLETPLIQALLEAALPVARVNPGNVRHFALGLGILAKTDPIDARVLCRFAELASPRLSKKRACHLIELDALVGCRRQLVKTRTEQTNRKLAAVSRPAKNALNAVLLTLDKQIQKLEKEIARIIDSDDDLKGLSQQLKSVPGVGEILASTLIAEVPELGKIPHRQLAALIGVAPINHDSGSSKGRRSIRGGRPTVRAALYMAAVCATRFNPLIKDFFAKLKAKAKPGKAIIVACMHKLLTLLNVMAERNLVWQELEVVKSLKTA
jgi:transposase